MFFLVLLGSLFYSFKRVSVTGSKHTIISLPKNSPMFQRWGKEEYYWH